ncbi:hypothetical protein BJV78DRAFT_1158266 [Lactifluus subvellereus]|nr:hypothetical protein BJV78DRAFT_1158266 [Lactifluus subvellereus]
MLRSAIFGLAEQLLACLAHGITYVDGPRHSRGSAAGYYTCSSLGLMMVQFSIADRMSTKPYRGDHHWTPSPALETEVVWGIKTLSLAILAVAAPQPRVDDLGDVLGNVDTTVDDLAARALQPQVDDSVDELCLILVGGSCLDPKSASSRTEANIL